MGLRPDEREDFARQFAAAQDPAHREEILQRAAGFGPGEALGVMRLAEARKSRGPVPNITRPPVAYSPPARMPAAPAPQGIADDGPEIALPVDAPQRPVMVDMKPEDRARAAAERAFAGNAPAAPAVAAAAPPAPAAPPPPAPPLARQPDPAARPEAPGVAAQAGPAPNPRREMYLQRQFAEDVAKRYVHLLPPGPNGEPNPYTAAIYLAAAKPGGMEELKQFATTLRRQDEANRALAARQRANDYNLSQDSRSPNYAPGMRIRSLMRAVDENNPMAAAAVNEIAGNPMGAARFGAMDITQRAGDAQVKAAQAEAAGRAAAAAAENPNTPPTMIGKEVPEQLSTALKVEDPTLRYESVYQVVKKLHPEGNEGQWTALTQSYIAAHMFRTSGAQDPAVLNHLNTLRKNKPAFIDFAVRHLGMNPQQAELYYNSGQATPEQLGQQAAQGMQDAATGAAGWAGGFWRGLTGGGQPKPQG